MCENCAQQVREIDIKDEDLQYLPYKLVKWCCCVPGCKGGLILRDYGISPLYYWPVKVKSFLKNGEHRWRGGWISLDVHAVLVKHYGMIGFNLCWKHLKIYERAKSSDLLLQFWHRYNIPVPYSEEKGKKLLIDKKPSKTKTFRRMG